MNIKYKKTDPFFLTGSRPQAVLLIHGFTGSPAEMKLLGEYLHQKDYTVSAPVLAGHGTSPEEMAKTTKEDWFQSVLDAYSLLEEKGYEQIVAIGLSMGGVLALKLAMHKPLRAVVSLAAPVFVQDKRIGWSKWLKYFLVYKKKIGQKPAHIEQYLDSYDRTPIAAVDSLNQLIKEVKKQLPTISVPVQVMQGKRDETVQPRSAQYIYEHLSSKQKQMKWYEKSSHIMTLDHEKNQIFEDIHEFLVKI